MMTVIGYQVSGIAGAFLVLLAFYLPVHSRIRSSQDLGPLRGLAVAGRRARRDGTDHDRPDDVRRIRDRKGGDY